MSHAFPNKSTRKEILQDRAQMLLNARTFFNTRGLIEVDCPLLSPYASVDAHIDLIPVFPHAEKRYLHSSPEYGMKRLLAEGFRDIYQLSHVFRDGEVGSKHNPEFMMAEWYHVGYSFQELIDETLQFIQLFIGQQNSDVYTYRDLFLHYLQIDPFVMDEKELRSFIISQNIDCYQNMEKAAKDELLHFILGCLIEPRLGSQGLTVVKHFPASQAALAQVKIEEGFQVAERFEVYYKGVELANGYHELADAKEQKDRLEEANAQRVQLNKEPLPIDNRFLEALERGIPDCCGVAVGFDRLMMLRHDTHQISDVIPFHWHSA